MKLNDACSLFYIVIVNSNIRFQQLHLFGCWENLFLLSHITLQSFMTHAWADKAESKSYLRARAHYPGPSNRTEGQFFCIFPSSFFVIKWSMRTRDKFCRLVIEIKWEIRVTWGIEDEAQNPRFSFRGHFFCRLCGSICGWCHNIMWHKRQPILQIYQGNIA